MKQRILLLVALFAMVATVAFAQGTGSLSGTARDASNQALSGVKVQLRNVDTGAARRQHHLGSERRVLVLRAERRAITSSRSSMPPAR